MTEVRRIADLLERSVAATHAYEVSRVEDESLQGVVCRLRDATVLIDLESDADGRVVAALSFLLKHGKQDTLHLNYWKHRGVECDADMVSSIWHAFWQHECENQAAGRVLWMHGPVLPRVASESPFGSGSDVLGIFGD